MNFAASRHRSVSIPRSGHLKSAITPTGPKTRRPNDFDSVLSYLDICDLRFEKLETKVGKCLFDLLYVLKVSGLELYAKITSVYV